MKKEDEELKVKEDKRQKMYAEIKAAEALKEAEYERQLQDAWRRMRAHEAEAELNKPFKLRKN